MTINELIRHLENLSVTTGDDIEVKVLDDIELWSYAITPESFLIQDGVLLIR